MEPTKAKIIRQESSEPIGSFRCFGLSQKVAWGLRSPDAFLISCCIRSTVAPSLSFAIRPHTMLLCNCATSHAQSLYIYIYIYIYIFIYIFVCIHYITYKYMAISHQFVTRKTRSQLLLEPTVLFIQNMGTKRLGIGYSSGLSHSCWRKAGVEGQLTWWMPQKKIKLGPALCLRHNTVVLYRTRRVDSPLHRPTTEVRVTQILHVLY